MIEANRRKNSVANREKKGRVVCFAMNLLKKQNIHCFSAAHLHWMFFRLRTRWGRWLSHWWSSSHFLIITDLLLTLFFSVNPPPTTTTISQTHRHYRIVRDSWETLKNTNHTQRMHADFFFLNWICFVNFFLSFFLFECGEAQFSNYVNYYLIFLFHFIKKKHFPIVRLEGGIGRHYCPLHNDNWNRGGREVKRINCSLGSTVDIVDIVEYSNQNQICSVAVVAAAACCCYGLLPFGPPCLPSSSFYC